MFKVRQLNIIITMALLAMVFAILTISNATDNMIKLEYKNFSGESSSVYLDNNLNVDVFIPSSIDGNNFLYTNSNSKLSQIPFSNYVFERDNIVDLSLLDETLLTDNTITAYLKGDMRDIVSFIDKLEDSNIFIKSQYPVNIDFEGILILLIILLFFQLLIYVILILSSLNKNTNCYIINMILGKDNFVNRIKLLELNKKFLILQLIIVVLLFLVNMISKSLILLSCYIISIFAIIIIEFLTTNIAINRKDKLCLLKGELIANYISKISYILNLVSVFLMYLALAILFLLIPLTYNIYKTSNYWDYTKEYYVVDYTFSQKEFDSVVSNTDYLLDITLQTDCGEDTLTASSETSCGNYVEQNYDPLLDWYKPADESNVLEYQIDDSILLVNYNYLDAIGFLKDYELLKDKNYILIPSTLDNKIDEVKTGLENFVQGDRVVDKETFYENSQTIYYEPGNFYSYNQRDINNVKMLDLYYENPIVFLVNNKSFDIESFGSFDNELSFKLSEEQKQFLDKNDINYYLKYSEYSLAKSISTLIIFLAFGFGILSAVSILYLNKIVVKCYIDENYRTIILSRLHGKSISYSYRGLISFIILNNLLAGIILFIVALILNVLAYYILITLIVISYSIFILYKKIKEIETGEILYKLKGAQ